jgi:hypothetical protein
VLSVLAQPKRTLAHVIIQSLARLWLGLVCTVHQAAVVGGADKLRNALALSDASTKLLRFISDDVWGSKGFVG